MAHISVVIPVYKNEDSLRELYDRLRMSIEHISKDFEIVMVEDCGYDRSWEIIKALVHSDKRVKGIQFSRNFGQHYGISAGLDHCNGDWVVIMDADLQDRPEEIHRLYKKAMEGYDIVLARRGRRKDSIFKRFSSYVFYSLFSYLSNIEYDRNVGNFRIISRKVVENFRLMRENLRFLGGMLQWMGFPTAYIDVQHDERFRGKSAYTLEKLLKLAGETIIAYSDKPLKLSIKIGFIMSLLSFIYGSYIIFRAFFYNSPVTGWSSLIVSMYFLSGIIIALLGVLGIYLGKTFDETKKRPLYIISNIISNEKNT